MVLSSLGFTSTRRPRQRWPHSTVPPTASKGTAASALGLWNDGAVTLSPVTLLEEPRGEATCSRRAPGTAWAERPRGPAPLAEPEPSGQTLPRYQAAEEPPWRSLRLRAPRWMNSKPTAGAAGQSSVESLQPTELWKIMSYDFRLLSFRTDCYTALSCASSGFIILSPTGLVHSVPHLLIFPGSPFLGTFPGSAYRMSFPRIQSSSSTLYFSLRRESCILRSNSFTHFMFVFSGRL